MSSSSHSVAVSGIALVAIYSVQFVAARFSLQGSITPTGLTVIRYVIAGLVFLPFICLGDGFNKARQLGVVRILALSIFAGFPYLYVINSGIALTSAGYVAAVGPGSIVLFSFLLPLIMLRDKPDGVALVSTTAIAVGIILFIYNTFLVESISLIGTALFVLQGFMFSMYGVLIKRWSVDAVLGTAVVSLTSCVPAIYLLATETMGLRDATVVEIATQAVVQGLLAGAASVLLYSHIVQMIGPQRASLFMPSVPIITTIAGYLILNEILTFVQILGVLAMVFGMAAPGMLSIWRNRVRMKPST